MRGAKSETLHSISKWQEEQYTHLQGIFNNIVSRQNKLEANGFIPFYTLSEVKGMVINMDNIKEKVRMIIVDMSEKKRKEICDDTDLFDAGVLDSLNMIRLVTSVQSEFEIELAFEDLIPQNLGNIIAVENLIKKYIKSA